MKKERKPIKVSISNVEDMETIEKKIEDLKTKQAKPVEENIEDKMATINAQIKDIIYSPSNYEKQVRDNYNFLASLDYTDKSYELVENSFDIHFRKILYEGIIAFISDKNKAIEIYNSDHVNKLMKDINEYVSSMLHLTDLQAADYRMRGYLTKLLQNISTTMSFFYNLYNLDTKHRSYTDIIQYLVAFMTVKFPADGKNSLIR